MHENAGSKPLAASWTVHSSDKNCSLFVKIRLTDPRKTLNCLLLAYHSPKLQRYEVLRAMQDFQDQL